MPAINVCHALGSRKHALTPSTSMISCNGRKTQWQSFWHHGHTSRRCKWRRQVVWDELSMAKMPPHPASEQDTGQEELWQTVCSLNCSLQEGDPRLLKPKLRQSFTATAPYCNTADPLWLRYTALSTQRTKRRFPETGNRWEILVCHMMNFSPS